VLELTIVVSVAGVLWSTPPIRSKRLWYRLSLSLAPLAGCGSERSMELQQAWILRCWACPRRCSGVAPVGFPGGRSPCSSIGARWLDGGGRAPSISAIVAGCCGLVLCSSSTLGRPRRRGRVWAAARRELPLPGRPWQRGGRLSSAAPLFASPASTVFAVVVFLPSSVLWLLGRVRACGCSGERGGLVRFLEFIPGGLRRLASVSPSRLNGCREPLRCFDAPQASARYVSPSGPIPRRWRGGRRHATPSVARQRPEDLIAFLRCLRSFLRFFWTGL
jgi:hypothetical protein